MKETLQTKMKQINVLANQLDKEVQKMCGTAECRPVKTQKKSKVKSSKK